MCVSVCVSVSVFVCQCVCVMFLCGSHVRWSQIVKCEMVSKMSVLRCVRVNTSIKVVANLYFLTNNANPLLCECVRV